MTKKQKIVFSILIAIINMIIIVISIIVLPSSVVTQFGTNGNVTKLPKAIPLILELVLGVGGAVVAIVKVEDEKIFNKSMIVSAVGLIISIITVLVNILI